MAKARFSFADTITKIRETDSGKEATMYGPLRDLFINVLGYAAADVDIDTSGEGGRPDVTVLAPSGMVDARGRPIKISWIVVEAKDERDAFSDEDSREEIYGKKSKYIGTNTAWFVMVDPTVLIARPVGNREAVADIIVNLSETTDAEQFLSVFRALHATLAGVSGRLQRFRDGDIEMIAVEKLSKPDPRTASKSAVARYLVTRKRFFATLREATQHLQDACLHTLAGMQPTIQEYVALRNDFEAKWGNGQGVEFNIHTLTMQGHPSGADQVRQHDKEARALRKRFLKAPHIARLALSGLPSFRHRTGADEKKVEELFAIESANLILARILLIRFFEDHSFFGHRKYVCNGGVSAFQKMREYFEASYTHLLEQAYKQASRLYSTVFDETELDWVFGAEEPELSRAIEWAMFQFSRYDFETVKGDILTGIYDRFMDRDKRKKMGEFYTPPSIARYIVKRVGIRRGDKVFDPACGSGTFLIEAYREMIGDAVDRGAAEFSDVVKTLNGICGNDLNTFSAVLSHIQLLWHILGFKREIQEQGFPDIPITSRINSLVVQSLYGAMERFAELDVPDYAAVIGNPPYVRPERSAQELDPMTARWFERWRNTHPGVSSKLNLYALFLYRALHSWCRPAIDGGQEAGKLGFIVQLALFDGNDTTELRQLFAIGGRWTILEIVDLEIIYREIFDADVIPAIIICENRPARIEDNVTIRIAARECVKREEGAAAEFDFDSLPVEHIPYQDVFTPDGRILTRLTAQRLSIVKKLRANGTLKQVAKRYWVRKDKNRIVEWLGREPNALVRWEERRMIQGGIAFRGEKPQAKVGKGLDIFKGENIIATEIQGDPVERNCDVSSVDDPSLWKYASILPEKAYAVARVAHCVNAVAFDPKTIAFTNTATIFVPESRVSSVPFDLLFLSNVYVFFYAIAARMGVLRTCRSDIYPTNLAFLPWNDELIKIASDLESMRDDVKTACRNEAQGYAGLFESIDKLELRKLKSHIMDDHSSRITFGENFDDSSYEAEVFNPSVDSHTEGLFQIRVSDGLFDWVELNNRGLAEGLLAALRIRNRQSVTKSQILNLSIPLLSVEHDRWKQLIEKFDPAKLDEEKNLAIRKIDVLLAPALGLDMTEIDAIQKDCREDAFLKRIRPRYPGTITRKQGFRTGLDSSERYT